MFKRERLTKTFSRRELNLEGGGSVLKNQFQGGGEGGSVLRNQFEGGG